jgi:hypothetical protein
VGGLRRVEIWHKGGEEGESEEERIFSFYVTAMERALSEITS